MKFSFKIQQYQTDAVDAVARVFQGQPYNAGVSYLRDMGSLSAQPQQKMKFSFKIQQYQTDAVDAVARVFQGQPYNAGVSYLRDMGSLSAQPQQLSLVSNGGDATQVELQDLINDSGFKNEALQLTDQELLQNIRTLQAEANIHQSDKLVAPLGRCSLDIEMETGTGKTYVYIKTMFELNKRYGWSKFIVVVPSIAIREGVKKSFEIEMETGTGKTYVYIKTMFELNKRYGWSKFIVVVPSIAIREGVKKSFEITADHFMECYGKKARFFIYNSSNLNQLDSFSSNSGINVMIINTQAFAASMNEDKNVEGRKGDAAARIIYTKRDEFGSRRPIDVIAANRPILILDEPQKMGKEDSATQKALKKFNPLFTLNYSATHAKQHNLIYVLDALDAYNKRLVKKIEVKGFEVKNLRGTDKYLYLESVIISPKNPPRAKVELEVSHQNGTKREFHTLDVGDNLYYISEKMEQYKGFVVSEIDPITGVVTFTNGDTIRKGDVTGDVSENDMRRVQIHETILSHFEKEQELFKLGIKTLSLFFIDEVAKYRQYDEDGNELLGEYGNLRTAIPSAKAMLPATFPKMIFAGCRFMKRSFRTLKKSRNFSNWASRRFPCFSLTKWQNTASTMKTETSCWASTARFLSRSIFRF